MGARKGTGEFLSNGDASLLTDKRRLRFNIVASNRSGSFLKYAQSEHGNSEKRRFHNQVYAYWVN